MDSATVPEAAIYEYSDAMASEDDIRPHGYVSGPDDLVLAEP
jgi:hypothetical protein